MKLKALTLLFVASLTVGCSGFYDPLPWGAGGAVAGGVIGAGTGAAIGSAIPNGVISASAITGAVVGIPVGIGLGLAYASWERGADLREAKARVESNETQIQTQNEQLERLREKLRLESSSDDINTDNSSWVYPGPTLGAH